MTNCQNNALPMRNIVLIGFMGSGKSTIGRELNKSLGYQFIDTDQLIEQQAGKTIPQIFEQDGEEVFRDMETQLIQEMINQKPNHHIISTGGGTPLRPENQTLLQDLGFVVWLTCTPEDILQRTSRSKDRPLLNCDDPLPVIMKMLAQRNPIYEQTAHLTINTSSLAFDEIACGILESARYHFGSNQHTHH